MHKNKFLLILLAITVSPSSLLGALSINIRESTITPGNATFEFSGTGQIIVDPFTNTVFNLNAESGQFLVGNLGFLIRDDALAPLMLGASSANSIFITNILIDGELISRIGLGVFLPGLTNGSEVSDLNGSFETSFAFSNFIPGTYSLVTGPDVLSDVVGFTDGGPITLTVGPVPEPSSTLFLLVGSLFLLRRQRS